MSYAHVRLNFWDSDVSPSLARRGGALGALTPAKRGPKRAVLNPLTAELARAKRENARLGRRLEHAEAIIEVQKKVAALLGIPLATPDSDDES